MKSVVSPKMAAQVRGVLCMRGGGSCSWLVVTAGGLCWHVLCQSVYMYAVYMHVCVGYCEDICRLWFHSASSELCSLWLYASCLFSFPVSGSVCVCVCVRACVRACPVCLYVVLHVYEQLCELDLVSILARCHRQIEYKVVVWCKFVGLLFSVDLLLLFCLSAKKDEGPCEFLLPAVWAVSYSWHFSACASTVTFQLRKISCMHLIAWYFDTKPFLPIAELPYLTLTFITIYFFSNLLP